MRMVVWMWLFAGSIFKYISSWCDKCWQWWQWWLWGDSWLTWHCRGKYDPEMHNLFTSCIMAPCQSISSMRDNPGKPTTNIILREKTLNLLYTYNIGKLNERLSMDECSNGDQTIILGLQIFLDQRSLNSIDKKILMTQSEVCLVYSIRWSGWSSKFILILQSSS